MWKTEYGSTGRLVQLCIGYFVFYVITGVAVKYFQGIGMSDIEYNGLVKFDETFFTSLSRPLTGRRPAARAHSAPGSRT